MLITNFDEIHRGHEHFLAGNERLISDSEVMAGRHALVYVQEQSKFKRRTGTLQEDTTFRLLKTSGGRILRIENNAPYAGIVEAGSRPHVIEAKNGKALKFTPRGGKMMFRRRVMHPGTRPYKFLYNATSSAYRVLRHELETRMADLAKRF